MAEVRFKVGDRVSARWEEYTCPDGVVVELTLEQHLPAKVRGEWYCNGELTDITALYSNELRAVSSHTSHPHDPVYFPNHYTRNGIELQDVLEAWDLNHLRASCVAYIMRSAFKGSELQDLLKARRYLNREINRLQGRTPLDWDNHEEDE